MLRMSRNLALAAIAVGVFGLYPQSANAKCSLSSVSFAPDRNDAKSATGTTDGRGCTKQYNAGTGYAFTGISVASPPSNGTLTLRSYGFHYKPRKGFSGTDSFVVSVCATKEGRAGCSRLSYQIAVQQ